MTTLSRPGPILITVDLEYWFQVENLRTHFPRSSWSECELRIIDSTRKLLELFARKDVRATFFVLDWTAERVSSLIKEIQVPGHEIAYHGYNHELCTNMLQPQLKEDLVRSKKVLEDITGRKILGYRAPSFSITPELCTFLSEADYNYDSSYNDFSLHGRYEKLSGAWKSNRDGTLISENGLLEIPVNNLRLMNRVIPWRGGGLLSTTAIVCLQKRR